MPKTRLISPGSIPNHKLLKNLQLQDNYLSNDGGDEGIRITDAGNVGVNTTVVTPLSSFEVFNSNVQLDGGSTGYQASTAIVSTANDFTVAMVGGRFIFDDGTDAGVITGYAATNVVTVSTSQTVGGSGDQRAFKIYYPSVQVDTGASSTTLKIGNTSFDTSSGDISLASGGGGNIMMTDGTSNIFDFNVAEPSLTIYDDADTDGDRDYFKVSVGANGATTITTNDDDGTGADLSLSADGAITIDSDNFELITLKTMGVYLDIDQKYSSNVNDSALYIEETLNLGSGAGGNDSHFGIKYVQTQVDLAGWDNVYLMYLYGGDAARTFAIRDDGKVGIGVTDPASPLEIFNTASQLKISYDASNYADISVASDGHLEIATTGTDADLTLDSASGIMLETTNLYVYPSGSTVNSLSFSSTPPKLTINSAANSGDEFSIQVNAEGATTIETVDADTAVAHLTLDPDGELLLTPATEVKSDAPLKIKEAANAVADTAAYGQLWVKNEAPCELYFTTDAGDDIQITDGTSISTEGTGARSVAGDTDNAIMSWVTSDNTFAAEANLTFDGTDLLVASTGKLAVGDTATYIHQASDSNLAVVADGDITLDANDDIVLDANGANITFKDNNTQGLDFSNSSGDWTVKPLTTDKDIIFAEDGGTEIARFDSSGESLLIASGKKIEFADTGEYISGDGTDLTVASGGDVTLDATDDIVLDADGDVVSVKFGGAAGQIDFTNANSGDGIMQQKVDTKDLVIQQFDGDEVVRFTDGGDVKVTNVVYFAAETANTIGDGATGAIDWNVSQKQKVTITGTGITCNFTNPPGACNLLLKVVQGDGSDVIATWDSDIKWPGNDTVPTLSTGSGDIDIISFYFDGTNYFGVASLDFA